MTMPVPSPSVTQAKDLADRAIAFLIDLDIPPLPTHFAVAYEYCAGGKPDLRAEVDRLLGEGNLNAFALGELYERHLACDQYQTLRGMGNDLQNILQGLIQGITEVGEGAAGYSRTLEKHIASLDGQAGPETLRAVAGELLSATRDARSRNQSLQTHLEEAHKETESLRLELERHRREVLIDPLTGLFNRRAMAERLEEMMAAEVDAPLSMLVLDIDHFKRINDSYGHAVGDVVIRNVADTVRKCIRGEDMAVRYGGEEFVILLPATPLSGATKVAEVIRKRIEALRLVRRQDNFSLAPFTVSLGVAERRRDDTGESLFQRADQALYQAKNGGRNRVTQEAALH